MIDARIKQRHIQCFLEVARRRSVGKAAVALALSQPAVSKTLKELEEILGVSLMDRSRSGVFLSAFGEVFLRHAGASMAALRQGLDSIAQARDGAQRPIRVGVLPTVASRLAPDAVLRFKREAPETVVGLVSGPNRYLMDRLRQGDLDLVVGRLGQPDDMRDVAFVHLYSERVALLVRPGHPLLGPGPLDLTRLARYTVVLPDADALIRPAVDRMLAAHGVAVLPNRIETVSTSFGRGITRTSDAVWIISRGVAEPDLREGVLSELPVDTTDTSGPVGLTTRADIDPPAAVRLFMTAVRQAAAAMG
ncbi:pca operon transcription factor PcaQ [Arenibaculum pallidiluteum]|uniref:pca operon transcription factor PcaQ n=1 Tax=Arenibaculum pallidiluteum TaxID=2812559 RepID=UPI001A95B411|nr:pca operon transcription factor PcaQ [Arenibaculum pallidiluteum]